LGDEAEMITLTPDPRPPKRRSDITEDKFSIEDLNKLVSQQGIARQEVTIM
jgi:hypothetical protein